MPKSDFVPRTDNDFLVWHDQFKLAAPGVGVALGLTPAELTAITGDNTALHTKFSAAANAEATAQQATGERRDARRSAEQRARLLARRMKLSPTYTAAQGSALGIEGPEDTTDLSTAKPTLSARDLAHCVIELSFNKSKSDGVNLYGQRGTEPGFTFLARDTESPYVDNRPLLVAGQPEVRQYHAVYVLADVEVGLPSDVAVVTCHP